MSVCPSLGSREGRGKGKGFRPELAISLFHHSPTHVTSTLCPRSAHIDFMSLLASCGLWYQGLHPRVKGAESESWSYCSLFRRKIQFSTCVPFSFSLYWSSPSLTCVAKPSFVQACVKWTERICQIPAGSTLFGPAPTTARQYVQNKLGT